MSRLRPHSLTCSKTVWQDCPVAENSTPVSVATDSLGLYQGTNWGRDPTLGVALPDRTQWGLKAATQVGTTDGCEFLKDFAFTPDGRDVVTACGWPYYAVSYRLQGLVQDGAYQTGPYTNRVAISDRGRIAVGLNPSGPANLDLFSPGDATPTASLALGGPSVANETVTALAWVSCGRELLATVYDQLTSSVILYTIDFGAR